MNYNIDKTEQYALISLDESKFGENIAGPFEKMVIVLYREGYTNMIVDFTNIKEIDNDGLSLIRKATKACRAEGGLFVVATKDDDIIETIDSAAIPDLLILPTTDEAIDAVFMNELENDFREEEDDEYGFDSEGSFDERD
ncbi:MAG: anti-anti-sigma factor [Spirosomaceae bacterium]|nr:anti-anti-sigma factor [Spirosomataceae bacterium]